MIEYITKEQVIDEVWDAFTFRVSQVGYCSEGKRKDGGENK